MYILMIDPCNTCTVGFATVIPYRASNTVQYYSTPRRKPSAEWNRTSLAFIDAQDPNAQQTTLCTSVTSPLKSPAPTSRIRNKYSQIFNSITHKRRCVC